LLGGKIAVQCRSRAPSAQPKTSMTNMETGSSLFRAQPCPPFRGRPHPISGGLKEVLVSSIAPPHPVAALDASQAPGSRL
jgi:hypothetical protein